MSDPRYLPAMYDLLVLHFLPSRYMLFVNPRSLLPRSGTITWSRASQASYQLKLKSSIQETNWLILCEQYLSNLNLYVYSKQSTIVYVSSLRTLSILFHRKYVYIFWNRLHRLGSALATLLTFLPFQFIETGSRFSINLMIITHQHKFK